MKVILPKPSPLRPQVERSSAADNSLSSGVSSLFLMLLVSLGVKSCFWRWLCYKYLCYRTISTRCTTLCTLRKLITCLVLKQGYDYCAIRIIKPTMLWMLISLPGNILKEATSTTSAWRFVGWTKNEAIRRIPLENSWKSDGSELSAIQLQELPWAAWPWWLQQLISHFQWDLP